MSTWRARRLNRAARATNTPPLMTAAPKSHGAAAGAAALATNPAAVRTPETKVATARGSESQKPRDARAAARRAAARGVVLRPSLHGVVAEAAHGAEHVGQSRLLGVDGDGQRGRAEVDVCAAHAALLAQRALQLDRAVGAVHAGDVQHAPLAAVLAGQRSRQVEGPVCVRGQRAVLLAVGLRAGPAGEHLQLVPAQCVLVELHVEKAARDVRLDGVDAVEPQQLAADLFHAAPALRGAGKQEGEFEDALGHGRPPSAAAGSSAGPRVRPAREILGPVLHVLARDVEQHADVRVVGRVEDHLARPACAHEPVGAQHAQMVADVALAHLDGGGQVADAQLPGLDDGGHQPAAALVGQDLEDRRHLPGDSRGHQPGADRGDALRVDDVDVAVVQQVLVILAADHRSRLRSLTHLATSSEHMNGCSYVTPVGGGRQETPLDGRPSPAERRARRPVLAAPVVRAVSAVVRRGPRVRA